MATYRKSFRSKAEAFMFGIQPRFIGTAVLTAQLESVPIRSGQMLQLLEYVNKIWEINAEGKGLVYKKILWVKEYANSSVRLVGTIAPQLSVVGIKCLKL